MTAPSRFCHVVYKTHRYNEMIEWYQRVFEARIQHRDDRLLRLMISSNFVGCSTGRSAG
jgi:hypothetical protein